MLSFLRRRPQATSSLAPVQTSSLPVGRRCYAVGDIHGCFDLLDEAVAAIRADMEEPPAERAFLVFLGDLIDRGPDSARILTYLRTADWSWITPVFLLGNHEEAMLASYDGDTDALRSWVGFGGLETAESYGVSSAPLLRDDWLGYLAALRAAVPEADIAFLRGFYDQFELGDYLFVHAGVRPGVALDRQNPRDLRWIRDEFLFSKADFGKIVVHGHTIVAEPQITHNRIGIDTGAYRTGCLTTLRLEGNNRQLTSTSPTASA